MLKWLEGFFAGVVVGYLAGICKAPGETRKLFARKAKGISREQARELAEALNRHAADWIDEPVEFRALKTKITPGAV